MVPMKPTIPTPPSSDKGAEKWFVPCSLPCHGIHIHHGEHCETVLNLPIPNTRVIPLNNCRYYTLVDAEDYERCRQLPISAYAVYEYGKTTIRVTCQGVVVNGKKRNIPLARLLVDAPEGKDVDHKNRDTLDNRKSNLRLCNDTQNAYNRTKASNNTSGYKGVTLSKTAKTNKWKAQIKRNNKAIHLGTYETAEEAARAYDKAHREIAGEFAVTNFPEERLKDEGGEYKPGDAIRAQMLKEAGFTLEQYRKACVSVEEFINLVGIRPPTPNPEGWEQPQWEKDLWDVVHKAQQGHRAVYPNVLIFVRDLLAQRDQATLEFIEKNRKKYSRKHSTDENRYPHGYNQALSDIAAYLTKGERK